MCRGRTAVIASMLVAECLLGARDAKAEKTIAERRRAPNFMRVVQWNLCVMGDYLAPPYSGEEDDATHAALARFARDRGMPAPAKLDAESLDALTRAVDSLYPKSLLSLPSMFFTAEQDHVIAAGTWAPTVGSPAKFELNSVHVRCAKPVGCQIAECGVTQTNDGTLMLGHPPSSRTDRWSGGIPAKLLP